MKLGKLGGFLNPKVVEFVKVPGFCKDCDCRIVRYESGSGYCVVTHRYVAPDNFCDSFKEVLPPCAFDEDL